MIKLMAYLEKQMQCYNFNFEKDVITVFHQNKQHHGDN